MTCTELLQTAHPQGHGQAIVWEQHRLVLDGLRAREPWRVLEDWVVDYRLEKDPALLRRCTDLAQDLDGADGVFRLRQLMLQHGVDDPEARAVIEQAEEQHATDLSEVLPI